MNTYQAIQMTMANRNNESMVFDWDKAARIIKEQKPSHAEAGLKGDWISTFGVIWKDGKPYTNTHPFLASNWAPPAICINGNFIECYRMESEVPGWDHDTVWPKSAKEIVMGK